MSSIFALSEVIHINEVILCDTCVFNDELHHSSGFCEEACYIDYSRDGLCICRRYTKKEHKTYTAPTITIYKPIGGDNS